MSASRQRIGIVTGLRFERAVLTRWKGALGGLAPLTACAAANTDKARTAAEEMVAQGVRGLVSFGIAGALNNNLKPGVLVIAQCVLDEDGNRFETDAAWSGRLKGMLLSNVVCSDATLVSVAQPVVTVAGKANLHQKFGTGAVDMESAAVALIAQRNNLPFLVVRAIADAADQELPEVALAAANKNGSVSIGAALRALIQHPSQLPSTLRLGRQSGSAKRTLARVAHAGLPNFGLL